MAGACSHLQIPVFFTFVNMYGNKTGASPRLTNEKNVKILRGGYTMNELMKEFYDSELCEASRSFELSEEGKEALKIRDDLYEQLEKSLSKKDHDMLERYLDANGILSNEEIFHAYIGGMKDLIRFASGIFM